MIEAAIQTRLKGRIGDLALEVEFTLERGTLVLLGPNGAGKTSVLSMMLGLLPVTEGFLRVKDAILVDTARAHSVPVELRRLGYVPQDDCLFPHLSVYENLAFAARAGGAGIERRGVRRHCEQLLSDLGISELAPRAIGTLSGGERQRVALARALSIGPRALFLDEPLSALDVRLRSAMQDYLRSTLKRLDLPTIIITHDPLEARALADRIAIVEAGRMTQTGTWDELVSDPRSEFVQAFTSDRRA